MKLTRREILGTVGIAAGSCALSSCAMNKPASAPGGAKKTDYPWIYTELDPDTTAETAYYDCIKGHCMYGVFASVLLQLAKEHGEPYRSFPVESTRRPMPLVKPKPCPSWNMW